MPVSDTYFRYLLSCALKDDTHIKSIYALCLDDPKKTVNMRYTSLFCYQNFKFINSEVGSLFLKLGYHTSLDSSQNIVTHLPDSTHQSNFGFIQVKFSLKFMSNLKISSMHGRSFILLIRNKHYTRSSFEISDNEPRSKNIAPRSIVGLHGIE